MQLRVVLNRNPHKFHVVSWVSIIVNLVVKLNGNKTVKQVANRFTTGVKEVFRLTLKNDLEGYELLLRDVEPRYLQKIVQLTQP